LGFQTIFLLYSWTEEW